VIATGARPCDTAAKRELFTEETQTVLVFERGAVIRLSAAVADGQLLFLSNKATGKEVVTQVLRKRAFRPTNCYVDLEFTEACPGFWGIEFPKAGTALAGANAAKSLSSDEDSDNKPAKPATPPSLQEVDRLKHEVAELQTQLLSLQTGESSIPSAAPQIAARAASEIGTGSAKRDEEKQLEELFAMEAKQEEAQSPKRSLAYPRRSAPGEKEKSGSKTWMIAAGAVIVLIAAAGGAYRYGGFAAATKTAASKPASTQSQALSPAPVTASPKITSTAQTSDAKNLVANSGAVPSTENKTGNVYVDDSSITVTEVPAKAPALNALNSHVASPGVESKRRKAQSASELHRKSEVTASNAPVAAGSEKSVGADAAVSSIQEDDVAPKLIKGSKSVSPPEAIQNYIAGNVKVDAVVDTTGHIKSVTILSGPAKLHATATEVMKQYLYEPARRKGKPVPAHVQVSLQFWYAP
jgi:Gram-negative bacterial TonB protein C-terminal